MNDRDTQTVLDRVRDYVGGGVYRKIEFVSYRETQDGRDQEIAITILDAGPNSPARLRYQCKARSDDGKHASGNPSESLETALTMVRWGELDPRGDDSSS